jgi:hypothetical protein
VRERARGGKSRRGVASEVAKKKKKQLIYQSGQLPHSTERKNKKKYFLRPVDGFFILVFFFFGLKILRKAIPTRHSPIKFLQIVLRPYASLAFHTLCH